MEQDKILRECKKCGCIQPLDKYPKAKQCYDGRAPTCKACKNKKQRKKYISGTSYKEKDRNKHYLRKYGITIEDYNQMLVEQKGMCKICGTKTPGDNITNFIVDHCHDTGVVRGLLCRKCNTGIGYLQDSYKVVQQAAYYLKETQDD